MKQPIRLTPLLLLAALLAGCQGPCEKLTPLSKTVAPAVIGGSADFTRFAAVGTSISAGYQSGGLVNRHQINAFPAIFARQIGMTVLLDGMGTFSEPTVDGNGLNPLLQLRSLSPVTISNSGLAPGTPTNTTFPAPYGNMGVPGALVYDFANTTRYAGGAFPLVTRGLGSIQNQMLSLNPTFISFEFGANEVLGSATSGTAVQAAPTVPAAYGFYLNGALTAIHSALPNAKLALLNVPDVRSIPFFTTFPPLTRDVRTGGYRHLMGWVHRDTLIGGNHFWTLKYDSLAANELILLTAQTSLAAGVGFQAYSGNYLTNSANGTGAPLDSALILDAAEQDVIAGAVTSMNATVSALAAAPWIAPVDLNGLLASMAANGTTIGATHYTTAFVSGGLFSLDGVHPTDLGHAIIANALIDAVNVRFGSTVPEVSPAAYASASASSARPVGIGEGGVQNMRIEGLDASLRALFRR